MVVLNEAKPKYEKLDLLLESKITNIKFTTKVNIIIDLKEILRKFFRPDVTPESYSQRALKEEITADIINVVAHYRNYFYKRGKYTDFYILDDFGKSEILDSYYPGYRKDFYEKYIYNEDEKDNSENAFKSYICKKVCNALEIISKQFPHVYYLKVSDYGEVSYIKALINNINKNELVFILSNNILLYQFVSENVSIINIKGIKSELITPENVYKFIIYNKGDTEDVFEISEHLCALVLALAGVKKESIKNIKGISYIKAVSTLTSLVKSGKLEDCESLIIPLDFSKLDASSRLEKTLIENSDEIVLNYNIITCNLFSNKYKTQISNNISRAMIGSYSYQNIKELNEKVFTSFPIQIDMLLKGEKI